MKIISSPERTVGSYQEGYDWLCMVVKSQGIRDRENLRVEVILVMEREIRRNSSSPCWPDAIRWLEQLQRSSEDMGRGRVPSVTTFLDHRTEWTHLFHSGSLVFESHSPWFPENDGLDWATLSNCLKMCLPFSILGGNRVFCGKPGNGERNIVAWGRHVRENRSMEYGSVNKWGGGCGLHLNKTSSYLLKTNSTSFSCTQADHTMFAIKSN